MMDYRLFVLINNVFFILINNLSNTFVKVVYFNFYTTFAHSDNLYTSIQITYTRRP